MSAPENPISLFALIIDDLSDSKRNVIRRRRGTGDVFFLPAWLRG